MIRVELRRPDNANDDPLNRGLWWVFGTVLMIVSLLVAFEIMGPSSHARGERIGAAKGQISGLELALDMFYSECGRYPTTAEGLDALIVAPEGLKGWKGPYLKKDVPNDPWDHPYVYKSPGMHSKATMSYDLSSNGPDGEEGTADDIESWNLNKTSPSDERACPTLPVESSQ
jgi:general secretion pathway protein G